MDEITGLKLVRETMEDIGVKRIGNMRKLVGCADMLDTVIQILETKAGEAQKETAGQEAPTDLVVLKEKCAAGELVGQENTAEQDGKSDGL